MFSLESTRCLGTCGLSPVIMVDDQVYGPVSPAEAWGSDAYTPLAWWGSSTSRLGLGTSVVQLSARTPTACAMACRRSTPSMSPTLASAGSARMVCSARSG